MKEWFWEDSRVCCVPVILWVGWVHCEAAVLTIGELYCVVG